MGKRGPKPKHGSRQAAKPSYAVGALKCPTWLGKSARAVFRRTLAEMQTARTVAVIDDDLLAAYASAVADLEAVSVELDRAGGVLETQTTDRNGKPTGFTVQKANPLLKAKGELLGRVGRLADQLGIGPVSRSRVTTATAVGPDPGNKVLAIRAKIEAARAEFAAKG
jgi:P27 family predicted phage terminase small subunit